MGAAIPLLLQLSLSLPPILPFPPEDIHTEVLTGTVDVNDEVIPEDDDEDESSDGFLEVDAFGAPVNKAKAKAASKKRKKCGFTGAGEVTSPLQSVHWFRVVLDEAQ